MQPTCSARSLRDDAVAIWRAGVDAVRADSLVASAVRRDGNCLTICGEHVLPHDAGRIAVVGAGKAGAAMAAGLETALGDDLLDRVSGWINVPADCARPLKSIHLHAARPAGVNEPTDLGVAGSERILELVQSLGPRDVCIVLISGGGSALLPAPVAGVSLADKQAITRDLSQAGATINELNCVRKHLSRIKGGRLAAACNAGVLITLIISDVIGDPLDVIASGPTVPDTTTAADALAILDKFADRVDVPKSIQRHLNMATGDRVSSGADGSASAPPGPPVGQTRPPDRHPPSAIRHPSSAISHHVIGNIDVAMKAAEDEARQRGYAVQSLGGANTGIARDVGVELAERCLSLRDTATTATCLLSGGEPTVHVVPTDQPRRGGRNQELILAAVCRLWNEDLSRLALLSGGTDGEDGPTDAAGACIDANVIARAKILGLDPAEFLAINNSYPFFTQTGGHLKTGPTHTNVMDLRVGVIQ